MDSLDKQLDEVISKYTYLKTTSLENGYIISGILEFKAYYQEEIIRGKYNIKINIPLNFPKELPCTFEINNDVPKKFHKNYDGELCLGVITEIKIKFIENPTVLNYIDEFVIPYFCGFLYWQKHGYVPHRERSHGDVGVYEFFKGYLNIKDIRKILYVLMYILEHKKIKGHNICPCGSNKKIRNCHRKQLVELATIDFTDDLKCLIHKYRKKNKKKTFFIFPLTNIEIKKKLNIK